eukprot:s613_g1.t1
MLFANKIGLVVVVVPTLRPIVGGNWKCNPGKLGDAKALVEAWKEKGFDKDPVDVVIAPTALHLGHVKAPLEGLGMQVSAQNVGKNDMGAFTGEWTAAHLQDMEVSYTLIGHSERRSKYGETDEECVPELVNSKSEDSDIDIASVCQCHHLWFLSLRRHGMMSRLPCRTLLGAVSRWRLLAPGARGFAEVPAVQSEVQQAAKPRRPRRIGIGELNLPKANEKSKDALGTLDLEEDGAGTGGPEIKISEITSEDVYSLWPPQDMVADPEVPAEVRRPHLWLQHDDQDYVGTEDVGRFVKLTRNDLLEQLPEGGCGELARDLTLIPNRVRDIGLMVRKLTIELIAQLSELQDFTDSFGRKCIRKNGFLIDGHKGTGKSQVLNLVTMWARKNGWLVVLEPNPGRYLREIAEIKRSNNGIYLQSEFAQQFLEALSLANRQMLQEIPVDYQSYGSRGIDGEPKHATSRLYHPLIEKTVDTEAQDENLSAGERLKRIAKYRRKVRIPTMVDVLRQPQNVWEIVEFGLDREEYAVQAVAEAFVQLQQQTTHPVLVVVDSWNECFPCSEYVSIRYDNTRFHGYIPGYHLSMPRALHRWDGHKFRRGLKICATSWQKFKRRAYRPELLGVKDHEIRTVRNFTQQEFANYVMYLRIMKVLHNFPADDLNYFYMLTQGNGFQARKMLSTLY